MTLSLDCIAQKMTEYYPKAECLITRNTTIKEALLLEYHQTSFEPDVLYIGKASDFPESFPKDSTINLLCMADCFLPQKHKNNQSLNLLMLSGNNSIANIYNKIHALFQTNAKTKEIKEILMNCLFESDSLQRIADKAFELMGNPIALMVEGFKALVCTNVVLNNEKWNLLLKSRYMDHDAVHFHQTSAELHRCLMSRKPMICPAHRDGNMYFSNVFINNRLVATIVLHEICKEFSGNEDEILSVMSQIISIELQKSKYNFIHKAKSYEFLFNDLLQEKVISEQEINDRVNYVNLNIKEHLYVLTIDMSKQSHNNLTQDEVIDYISLILPDCYSVSFKTYVVTLISRDSTDLVNDDSMNILESCLKELMLSGGLSNSFSYIGDLKKYFRQAKKALELSLHLNDKKVICKYEDYAFHHLGELCSKLTNIRDICHPSVLLIREYDEKNSTDLLESLYFYLKYEKSINNAAQAMHVHRNTLYNRICKIKNIIEIDWDNYNVIKYMGLSIKILEYLESFSFDTNDNTASMDDFKKYPQTLPEMDRLRLEV